MDEAQIPSNDGLDLRDYLSGESEASPRDTFFFYHYGKLFGVRHKEWKLMFSRQIRDDHWHAYKEDAAEAERRFGKPLEWIPERLYNLQLNLDEATDRFTTEPEVVGSLKAIADAARKDLGDRMLDIKGSGVGQPGRIQPQK